MKYLKKMIIGAFMLASVSAFAQTNAEKSCGGILALSKKAEVKTVYDDCINSFGDLENIQAAKGMKLTTLGLKTDVGFSEAFKFLRQRAIREEVPSEPYKSVIAEFDGLKKQYSNYSSNVKPIVIKALDGFTSPEELKLKNAYSNNLTAQTKDIISNVNILSAALKSEKDRNMYAKSHNKISPILINVFVTKEYQEQKNAVFTAYDCKYLEMILPANKLSEMKTSLNYTCKS
jgi:hypothetical protein